MTRISSSTTEHVNHKPSHHCTQFVFIPLVDREINIPVAMINKGDSRHIRMYLNEEQNKGSELDRDSVWATVEFDLVSFVLAC